MSTAQQPQSRPGQEAVAGTPMPTEAVAGSPVSTEPVAGTPMPTVDGDRTDPAYRSWLKEAVRKVQADANRTADTHLLRFPLPEEWGIDLYLKDESTHPTGSLKHRLARSLFLYGLCNGWIRPGSPSSSPPVAPRPCPRRTSPHSSACRSSR